MPWQIFCGGSFCQARSSQTLFIKLLPCWLGNYTNWEYFYAPLPYTSTFCAWTLVPFYLNADIAHLPLSTAAARGFLVPKAPFCLLLEASVLPVFMKPWSLTQAVNPVWEILFGSKHILFIFTYSFLSRHVSKEYSSLFAGKRLVMFLIILNTQVELNFKTLKFSIKSKSSFIQFYFEGW